MCMHTESWCMLIYTKEKIVFFLHFTRFALPLTSSKVFSLGNAKEN